MHLNLLALAGLAEAALEMEWLICCAALAIVSVLLMVAWCVRSRIVLGVAAGMMIMVSLFMAPWQFLEPWTSPIPDPDVSYWSDQFRPVGIAWVVVLVATLTAIPLILIWRKPRRKVRTGFPLDETIGVRAQPAIGKS